MSVEYGSFTNGTTGNTTISLSGTFTPTFIDFFAGGRNGTTETTALYSFGFVDITNGNSFSQSTLSDTTSAQTKRTTSSCLIHYARVSGTITKVLDVSFVSSASGQFTVNLGTASTSYQISFKAYG